MVERMTEYAYGVTKPHQKKMGYINFLINITPDCDCAPWSDAPIVPDIGFVASTDPVAIDQASFDLVNGQIGLADSLLERTAPRGGQVQGPEAQHGRRAPAELWRGDRTGEPEV